MSRDIERITRAMRTNLAGVRFAHAIKVAEHFFGPGRQSGTSHVVFRMPWPGNPRVNLQEGKGGKAKAYQVQQLLDAIDALMLLRASEGNDDG